MGFIEFINELLIYPNWEKIANKITQVDETNKKEILNQILKFFEEYKNSTNGELLLLSKYNKWFINNGLFECSNPYFDEKIKVLETNKYSILQKTLLNFLNIQIPDQFFIDYCTSEVFNITPSRIEFNFIDKKVTSDELRILTEFSLSGSLGIFNSNLIISNKDNSYTIQKEADKVIYYSPFSLVNSYVEAYHKNRFLSLPYELSDLKEAIEYKGEKLYKNIIGLLSVDNQTQVLELITALQLITDIHPLLFNTINQFEFDCLWENEEKNKTFITFLKKCLYNDNIDVKEIHNKIVFNQHDTNIYLKDIDEANDSIKLGRDNKNIEISRTNLLLLQNNSGIKTIQEFANKCINLELITRKESEKLFKLTDSGITDELVSRFNRALVQNQLENKDQIAFVVFSGKIQEENIKDYNICSAKGEWRKLEGNWLFPLNSENELYEENYILSSKYSGIQELLQINDLETFIYGDKNSEEKYGMDSFFAKFLFQKACSSNVFKKKSLPLKICTYLFECWRRTRIDNRISKESEDWNIILGYNPKNKVIGDIIIEDEYIGNDISKWIQEDSSHKKEFLKDIGFNIDNSPIVKLREWFYSDRENYSEINISTLDPILLSNTLIGLADGFRNSNNILHFGLADKALVSIVKIVAILIENGNDSNIRLPYFISGKQLSLKGKEIEKPFYLNPEVHQLLQEAESNNFLDILFSHIPILYTNEELMKYIEGNYEELELKLDFIESSDNTEHSEPFYFKWRDSNKIKLFRCESINYQVSYNQEDKALERGVISKGNYKITEEENYTSVYYQRNLSLEALLDEISNNEKDVNEITSNLKELIKERDKTLTAFYNAITSSGRDDFNSEIAQNFMNTLKQKNIEDERIDLLNQLKKESKYSYNWFITYLKYLLSFEQLAETTAQKSITFQKIRFYQIDDRISDKYILLEGANNLIPINIEAFENFSISLVFKSHAKEKITIEGVSKKGQDLLVYCPKGIDKRISDNFLNVVNIKINFTPVLDLLQRLYNAFSNENYISEWDDVKEATPSINFLYGPPGTGKTTTISKKILADHEINPVFKCLVLTPTNKSADVLAKKIIENSQNVSVIRLGSATSPELEAIDDEIYQNDLDNIKLDSANVIISSIHRLPYYQVNNVEGGTVKLFSAEIKWDMIVFDEASMINLPYIVFALMAFKKSCPETKIIIAGDPKQIPPVIDTTDKEIEKLDIDDENIYKMFGINNITTVEQDIRESDSIRKLTHQYRSIEAIGKVFSDYSYQNVLTHDRKNGSLQKRLPESFINALKKTIAFIDIPIDPNNSVTAPKKLLYSSYHVHAGIMASELIKHLDNCIEDGSYFNIGIISPYKAQALLVNKLITSMNISHNLNVHCDTVHGFQGDECDIIIFIVNPNNIIYTGHYKSLLSKEYIYNVAISRAQDYLWIMNPYYTILNNPHINRIRTIHKENGGNTSIISSNEIEKEIFNDNTFIIKNSYLTGHDSINIFGSVEMKYFIKASDTAIDIQLRNQNQ